MVMEIYPFIDNCPIELSFAGDFLLPRSTTGG